MVWRLTVEKRDCLLLSSAGHMLRNTKSWEMIRRISSQIVRWVALANQLENLAIIVRADGT
jgi:hypothetical protein